MGGSPTPQWSALPPLWEWKLSSARKVCRQHIQVEKRQPLLVWGTLVAQQVPFKLKEFVLVVLWRKLPVAQCLAPFRVVEVQESPFWWGP